jgi:hypothetical protein
MNIKSSDNLDTLAQKGHHMHRKSSSRKALVSRRGFLGCLGITTLGLLTGCSGTPYTKYYFNPYVAKDFHPPEVKYCFDTVGHKRGTYPFVLGGTCCCTPTAQLLETYHEDGFLLEYSSVEELEKVYADKGIVLRHENGWACNNMCDHGPHVVFGGHCMVAPVVGTQNYENVATGKQATL